MKVPGGNSPVEELCQSGSKCHVGGVFFFPPRTYFFYFSLFSCPVFFFVYFLFSHKLIDVLPFFGFLHFPFILYSNFIYI